MVLASTDKESNPDSEDEDEICSMGKTKQQSWYLDSGCSRHMTGEKYMFLTLKEGETVGFGGNQKGKII
ncbi:zinc knuckle family protein, partial [Trifolium medium]|nr:zinc knuckle family protein [Trifolium medium]